jgi:ribosomal protein L37AE/L43A
MEDFYKKEMQKDKEYRDKLGEYLGYIDKKCINCGRQRVEQYKNGAKICEKCSYNQDTKEYDHEIHKYL